MENYKEQVEKLAEEMFAILSDSVEWTISDDDAEGDEFDAIHSAVCKQVVKKMLDITAGVKTYNRI